MPGTVLEDCVAAVDAQAVPGVVVGRLGSQIYRDPLEIFRASPTPSGDPSDDGLAEALICHRGRRGVGDDPAGLDRIDLNVVARQSGRISANQGVSGKRAGRQVVGALREGMRKMRQGRF